MLKFYLQISIVLLIFQSILSEEKLNGLCRVAQEKLQQWLMKWTPSLQDKDFPIRLIQ